MDSEVTTLDVRHLTVYRYERPVELGERIVMMRPRDRRDQRLVASRLVIEPRPSRLRWLYDAVDNCVALATFSGEAKLLRIENRFTVERTGDDSPGGEIDPSAQAYPFRLLRQRNCRTSPGRWSASIATRRARSIASRRISS